MKMIPAVLTASTESRAERQIFSLLRSNSLFPAGTALHSQNLNAGSWRAEAEADFVLLCEEGLLVLEIKGGGISRHDGEFQTVDAAGRTHGINDPFRQASSALHTLVDIIRQKDSSLLNGLLYGYAVVLPDVVFNVPSAEWPQEIVIDRRDMVSQSSFNTAVRRVFRHWRSFYPDNSGSSRTTDGIVRLLRPEFERLPSVTALALGVERELHSLTEAQCGFFDALLENERILCRGGAGTGKTFLLAEAARRNAAERRSVLVTCHSEPLARHLRSVLGPQVATVLSSEELGRNTEVFDVLLIDEAQDLMSMEDISQLDPHVAGGLRQGRWAVFYDSNLQARIRGVFDDNVEAFLLSTGAFRVSLPRNCRNTAEIARQTTLRTGGDIGQARAGAGMRVRELFFSSPREQEELAGQVISELRADGVRPEEVILLSPLNWQDSVFFRLAARHRIGSAGQTHGGQYPFARIDDFKGLEARFVIAGDIGSAGATDHPDIARLYVAMTRARAGLWLLIDERSREALDRLAISHMEQIIDADLKGRKV